MLLHVWWIHLEVEKYEGRILFDLIAEINACAEKGAAVHSAWRQVQNLPADPQLTRIFLQSPKDFPVTEFQLSG